mgnify:CR=1 FL=1
MTSTDPTAPVVALRGAMLSWTGDPFAVGAKRARRHDADAIVAMAGGRILHAGAAATVLRALPRGQLPDRHPMLAVWGPARDS